MNNGQTFRNRLGGFAMRWRFGLVLRVTLWGVGITAAAFILAAGLDAAFAFDETGLKVARALVVTAGVVAILCTIPKVVTFSRARAAREADRAAENPRRMITSASDLANDPLQEGMAGFLRSRVFEDGEKTLKLIPLTRSLPWRALGKAAVFIAVIAGLAGLAFLRFPDASRTTSARLIDPDGGIAPYSPLRFVVSPEEPKVVYGSDLLMEVEISGGEIDHPVVCLVRDPATGDVEETDSYRESAGKFAQKIGKVTNNLEIAFRCGRARSAWRRVDVMHQPRFAAAKVKVTPPAYTRQAESEFVLGTSELRVIEGSVIELKVESNRPLSGGGLAFVPAEESSGVQESSVNDPDVDGNSATFTWKAKGTGRVSVNLVDIRGTRSDSPLEFDQRATPDSPPEVAINEPARLVLATPKSVLPLKAEARDDFGLSKVELVRALAGFRDRASTVGDQLTTREVPVSNQIDLQRIGVLPGETLEFFVEAVDRNPSLMGIGTSDVVKIHIISEEDYAERIRMQTSASEFAAKFEAMREQLDKAKDSLDDLAKALDGGDEQEIAEARKKAEEAQQKAAEFFDRLEKDFPAFAMDQRAKEIAGKIAEKLRANQQDLNASAGTVGEQKEQVKKMQERLGAGEPEFKQLEQDAKDAAAAGKVMEMSVVFREVLANQESLTKRLGSIAKELAAGNTANARQLVGLAKQQRKNRERLNYLRDELEKRAKDLPDRLRETRESAEAFVARMDQLMIGDAMDAAEEGAKDGDVTTATTNSLLALQLLEQLIKKPGDQMCEMCKGGGPPKFEIKEPDLASTLAQMLAACNKAGVGQKPGGGGAGPGGGNGDGFSAFGVDSPALPMIGPERVRFVETGARGSQGRAGRSGIVEHATASDPSDGAEDVRDSGAGTPDIKAVPELYRDAVKRYFLDDSEDVANRSESDA